jgi:hypothetical protein
MDIFVISQDLKILISKYILKNSIFSKLWNSTPIGKEYYSSIDLAMVLKRLIWVYQKIF